MIRRIMGKIFGKFWKEYIIGKISSIPGTGLKGDADLPMPSKKTLQAHLAI